MPIAACVTLASASVTTTPDHVALGSHDSGCSTAVPCSVLAPHCAHFEPVLAPWVRTLPAQARFVAIPADFQDSWVPYARAYFAAQALGVAQRSHAAMYAALHDERSLPTMDATPEEIATFYQRYGIAPARFAAAYKAPTVDAQMKRAREFVIRSRIDGTPSLVVAGKYRVTASNRDAQLRTARWLVDREIAAAAKRR